MVASIGPFWDANETWLVLGIGLLLAAFPRAHGEILGALYLPVAAMLVGLMLRGVAFELRVKARGLAPRAVELALLGGLVPRLVLRRALMLGRYVTGFEPGFGYWLFALVVGASLCGGYVLLGATWLVLQDRGRRCRRRRSRWARWGLLWVALGVALVSLGTPLVSETVREKLVRLPAHARPDGAAGRDARRSGVWVWFARCAGSIRDASPSPARWRSSCSPSSGLAYSLFPYVVIDRLTIWEAAAHPSALRVVCVGAAIVLPFIVGYTVYVVPRVPRQGAARDVPSTRKEKGPQARALFGKLRDGYAGRGIGTKKVSRTTSLPAISSSASRRSSSNTTAASFCSVSRASSSVRPCELTPGSSSMKPI